MCGIAGYIDIKGNYASDKIINDMLNVIDYRGPDDKGIYVNKSLGMGHVRLSIVDVSQNAHQPFVTKDGKGVIVYNGELYNYIEIKKELINEGVEFFSNSDTEVFLYALYTWGVRKAIDKFRGMFAFAYYDYRENLLWIGRDRLGIKPLYYTIQNDLFVFGSEIKTLLKHPGVKCEPDMVALSTHIVEEYLESPWTTFKNIWNANPGCIYCFHNSELSEIKYYDVIDRIDGEEICRNRSIKPISFKTGLEQVVSDSVNKHLIGDVPIATFCSGGVDSSLITAFAKRFNNNIVAYVADVEDALPESRKAEIVGKHLGVEIKKIHYSTEEYLRDWPLITWFNDTPPVYRSDQAFMSVAKACRKDGIKVVLTGEGADELFAGYEWHHDAYKMWHYRKPFIKLLSGLNPESMRWHNGQRKSFAYKLNNYLAFYSPIDIETLIHNTFVRFPTPNPENMHNELRRSCVEDGAELSNRYRKLLNKLRDLPYDERALIASCINDLYGHIVNLLQRNDRMGMATSIESRIPFLDNKVIDYAMSLTARCRYNGRDGKWILKKVAEQYLPSKIVYAQKTGFSTSKRPYKYALPLIKNGITKELFGWNREYLSDLLEQLYNDRYVLYSIVGVELWARIFLKHESIEELGEQLVYNYKNNIVL